MRKLPPLVQLRAFEAAARLSSFAAAAAELGVTPTAVSHQILLLEEYFGQQLFRRRPRPVTLTLAGEQLFPAVSGGLDMFAAGVAEVRAAAASGLLRITATNAFAARWLVPRLPDWRRAYPDLRLEVIGTDAVLSLKAGEADVAVRYMRRPPPSLVVAELVRDRFVVVGSPSLVGPSPGMMTPSMLAQFPLIEYEWPPTDVEAPTWRRWEAAARGRHETVPPLASMVSFHFREELHAIETVIGGQGIAICSDVLVGRELAVAALVRLSDIELSGYGFYIASGHHHPKAGLIEAFSQWARAAI